MNDARAFLILHGLQGSGPDHWQGWIAPRLARAGAKVSFPALPQPEAPRLAAWLGALDAELERLAGPAPLTLLCHSLGAVLWLHRARTLPARVTPVDRVVLVAPPSASAAIPEIAEFVPVDVDRAAVARAARATRIVCADADPYCPEGAAELYGAPLGLPVDLIPGGGHLNVDAGFGPWPALEAWCYGAKNGVEA